MNYFPIPMDVDEWPTESPEEATRMAKAVRGKVQAFCATENLQATVVVFSKKWKSTSEPFGDSEVIKKIEGFLSDVFKSLGKE